ncbi:hypothetical protein V1520DRAFT_345042 [Lipomyces starkeyi]|uniref:Uncharacterized protein n=1 Tax=Lipomyces starkeyi NRRL Y-11557 TaxID=675824 RepID=A0A1E3QG73_LIPST|nr:hypothetical protein LIPSTDRAFT_67691 [Lipomyces starkeyi NRRL Y-11557]
MTDIDFEGYDSTYQVPDAIAETSAEQQHIDDHSLSYQSVQQIHDAFSSFWTSYAEKLIKYGIAGSNAVSKGGGIGCIAELHKRYVDIYLATAEFSNLTETHPDERSGSREERLSELPKPGNIQIPDFSPEPEDLELDDRLSKVERQIKRLDTAENSTKPLIKKRGRRARKEFTEPSTKRPQLKPTRGDRRGPGGLPRKPRIQARRGILSCEVIVNRYSQRAHIYQTTVRKNISGPFVVSKKKRKGRSKIDLDGLWAAHWRLARSKTSRVGQSTQKRRMLPYLRRALAKGKRLYEK